MAAQFGESRTILQPTQPEAPAQTNVFDVGAQVAGQQASALASSGQSKISGGLQLLERGWQTASAAFDQALTTYNRYAEQKAAEDAPAAIKRDGQGNIIPPSSFYPPGISTRAYAESYANTSIALYKSYAEQELIQHSALMREKYPTDTTAYAAEMARKRQAMQTNLDPRVAPWIDIRAEQIQAQGTTQIAVANQSNANAVAKVTYDRDLQGIKDDARRTIANTPIGQGGGGSQAGYDNNVGNVVISGDPYHGGKGLPFQGDKDHKFETFQSAEQGVAAAYSLIKKRVTQAGGTLSFAALVNIWSPVATPLEKANYATALAKAAGLGPGDAIPIDDATRMAQVVKAQNKFEKGKQTVADAAFVNGIALANGNTGVPRTGLATDAVTVADPRQLAQAADLVVQTQTIAERINNLRTVGKSHGRDPALIEHDVNEIKFDAQVGAMAEQIKNSGQALQIDGVVQQGAVAAADDRIREVAALPQFRGREKQVIDTLRGALTEAQTQASRQASQVQVDQQRAQEPVQRKMMADAAAAKLAALNGDSVTATAITRSLEQEGRRYLTDASLPDSVAMKMAGIAFQNGSVSRGALQEANNNRLEGMAAVASSPLASAEQKAAAYESARAIRSDPEIMRDLTSGQRASVQGIMDDHVRTNFGLQVAAFNSEILKGGISPEAIDRQRAYQFANNMIDPKDAAHIGTIDAAAKQAYNSAQTQSTLAGEFLANHAAGRNWTPDQLAAHKKELGWRPPGGAPSVDFSKPDHVAAVQEHYRKYGYMPDLAQSALDNIQLSPDEAIAAGPKAMLETIRQTERAKIVKQTGKPYEPAQETLLEHNVAAIVGKNYQYLHIATRNGALAASKVVLDSLSKSGNLGQTVDQSRGSLEQSVHNLEGILSKTSLNPVNQALATPLGALGLLRTTDEAGTVEKYLGLTRDEQAYTEDMTPEQKAVRAAAGITGLGLGDTLKGMTGLGDRGVVTTVIDPNFAKALVHNGGIHLATDGDAIRTGRPNGSAEDFVIGTALYTAIRNGEVSSTLSADGKTRTLGWKTLGEHVGPSLNVQMTPRMQQGFAAQLLATEAARTGGGLRPVDPDKTYVRSYQAANGQLRFYIAEQDRNGNFTRGMDLAKDDPRIGLQAMATLKSATQAVIANAADPLTYGQIVTSGGIVSGVGGLALIYKGDMVNNFWKMSTSVGNAIQQMQIAVNRPGMTEAILGNPKLMSPDQLEARKNMITSTQRMVQELDAEFKDIPDAPNAKAILSHMLEKNLPGTENTALRQLIINSGVYQPGRQPQVQTGPRRAGTSDPR